MCQDSAAALSIFEKYSPLTRWQAIDLLAREWGGYSSEVAKAVDFYINQPFFIVPQGETPNGVTLYRYREYWDELIAQYGQKIVDLVSALNRQGYTFESNGLILCLTYWSPQAIQVRFKMTVSRFAHENGLEGSLDDPLSAVSLLVKCKWQTDGQKKIK